MDAEEFNKMSLEQKIKKFNLIQLGTTESNGIKQPFYGHKGALKIPDLKELGPIKENNYPEWYKVLDKQIEPIINKLNKVGVETRASCSGLESDHLVRAGGQRPFDIISNDPYIMFGSVNKEKLRKIDSSIDGTQWKRKNFDPYTMMDHIDMCLKYGELPSSGTIRLNYRLPEGKKIEQIKKLDRALDDWKYL